MLLTLDLNSYKCNGHSEYEGLKKVLQELIYKPKVYFY